MSGLVVVDSDVRDAVKYEEYRVLGAPSVAKFGGTRLLRAQGVAVLEGDWEPKRLVVISFSSVTQARDWYESPAYAAAKELRHQCAATKMALLEQFE